MSTGHLPKFKTTPHPLATHLLLSSPFDYLGGAAINLVAKPSATGPSSVSRDMVAGVGAHRCTAFSSFLPSKLMLGCLATMVIGHLSFNSCRLPVLAAQTGRLAPRPSIFASR